MRVTVKLFAQFRCGRFKEECRDFKLPQSVGQVVADLGIVADEVGVLLVNSRHVSMDAVLVDGDVLGIFPLVGGG